MTTTPTRKTKPEPELDELQQFVTTICTWLNETAEGPRTQIALVVATIGTTKTMAVLKEVLAIEERGGIKTVYKKRRRTVGGVFFHLVKRRYGQKLPDAFWALTNHKRRPKSMVPGAKKKPTGKKVAMVAAGKEKAMTSQ